MNKKDAAKPEVAKPDGPVTVLRTRAQEHVTVYANVCEGVYSPWDIQLTFSRGENAGGSIRVAELVSLYLSPSHAKSVLDVLILFSAWLDAMSGPQGGRNEM